MKSEILDRYDITPDNRFIIDIAIPDSEELFEKYDADASFYKKDLNPRFEDYLLECVDEIGLKNRFIIRISLPTDQSQKTDEGDIFFSFKRYYKYCISICQKKIRTISFRMLLHIGFTLIALFLIMALNSAGTMTATGWASRMASGLPAAVWVLILTGLSRFIFRLITQRSDIKKYQALKNAPVEFVYNKKPSST